MENRQLRLLERIARSLPCERIDLSRSPSHFGEVYMACGLGHDRNHGVWGCKDIGRVLEFKPEASVDTMRRVLYADALFALDMFRTANMLDEGWWRSGRRDL